jgi:hypothetical protein
LEKLRERYAYPKENEKYNIRKNVNVEPPTPPPPALANNFGVSAAPALILTNEFAIEIMGLLLKGVRREGRIRNR